MNITAHDFQMLTGNFGTWNQGEWNPARFGNYTPGAKYTDSPGRDFAYAYWTIDSWVAVVLMISFLRQENQEYAILWDRATRTYTILTDYHEEQK